jgi:hypothetical protein
MSRTFLRLLMPSAMLWLAACAAPTPATPPTAAPAAPAATVAPVPPTAVPPTVAPPPTVVPTAAPTAATVAASAAGAPSASKVAEAMASARSYHVEGTSATADGKALELVWEVAKPDRAHMKVTQAGQTFEYFQIGPDVYLNVGGKWTKQASTDLTGGIAAVGKTADDLIKGFNSGADQGDTVAPGRQDIVDGTPCQEYVVTSSKPDRPAGSWCVGLGDNLPRRFVGTGTTGRSFNMTFSKWNAPIAIEAPI